MIKYIVFVIVLLIMAILSREHYSKYKGINGGIAAMFFYGMSETIYTKLEDFINLDMLVRRVRKLYVVSPKKAYEIDEVPDIHGMHLPPQYIFDLFDRLVEMSREERMQIPGLAKNRADVIVGGLIPISLALRNLQVSEVVFSNHGLRDGLLYEYLQDKKK